MKILFSEATFGAETFANCQLHNHKVDLAESSQKVSNNI